MKRSAALIVVIALLLCPIVMSAQEGSAGLAFLKLGVGARAIGLGDAYVALGGDASSIYWNPAGTVSVENIDAMLMHGEWFEGIRYEFAGGVKSDGRQAFGVGIVGLYMDDLERRDGPTSEPIGHFGVFDFALTGSYARRVTDYLDVGVALKYLTEKIDDESANGVAVDLGATYRVPTLPGLSAGVAIQNLGPEMSFIEDKFGLPVLFRAGAALSVPVEAMNGDFLVVADELIPSDGDARTHFGLEFEYARVLAVRFGYRTGWDNQNMSVGLGAKVRNLRLDYAYVPFYSELGDTHRISLGVTL